jgi:hypothetical protein
MQGKVWESFLINIRIVVVISLLSFETYNDNIF